MNDKENFEMASFEEINQQVKEITKDLTYGQKLNIVFSSLIPWYEFHNYRYREEVARESLGLPPKPHRKTSGEDLPGISLKSLMKRTRAKKTGMYQITSSQKLGEWGRIDLDTTQDKKDTVCDIWGDGGVIMRMYVYYDENFENLYRYKKEQKLLVKTDKKNSRDAASFNIGELIKFGVNYEITFVNEKNTILKVPKNNPPKSNTQTIPS